MKMYMSNLFEEDIGIINVKFGEAIDKEFDVGLYYKDIMVGQFINGDFVRAPLTKKQRDILIEKGVDIECHQGKYVICVI